MYVSFVYIYIYIKHSYIFKKIGKWNKWTKIFLQPLGIVVSTLLNHVMIQLLVSVHFYETSSSEPSRMQVRQQVLNECSVTILVFSSKPLRPIMQELMLVLSKRSCGKDFDPFLRLTFPWMVGELTIEGQSCLLELTWAISRCSHAQQWHQGQRSPRKVVGGANSHLESNPIPTRDAQRAQTNLIHPRTQEPQRDWDRTAFGHLLWRYRSAVDCHRDRGSGCSRLGYGISHLGGGRH